MEGKIIAYILQIVFVMRKNIYLVPVVLLFISLSMSSCEAIGNIFKAGVWTGFLLIAVVVAVIIWIVARARKK